MRTGRYRVRRNWRGKAILQAEYDSPSFYGGHVDSSIRVLRWEDVTFDALDRILFQPAHESHTEDCSRG